LAAFTRASVSCSVAWRALPETHLPYAFLPFLFVPYFFVNAAGSAARSALHSLAPFLRSVAARPSRLATHAFVAVDALLVGYVSVNVFLPHLRFLALACRLREVDRRGPFVDSGRHGRDGEGQQRGQDQRAHRAPFEPGVRVRRSSGAQVGG
jgi:hypothetical protein